MNPNRAVGISIVAAGWFLGSACSPPRPPTANPPAFAAATAGPAIEENSSSHDAQVSLVDALLSMRDSIFLIWGATSLDPNSAWIGALELSGRIPDPRAFLRSTLRLEGFVGTLEELDARVTAGVLSLSSRAGFARSIEVPEGTLIEKVDVDDSGSLVVWLDLPDSISTAEQDRDWSNACLAFRTSLSLLTKGVRAAAPSTPAHTSRELESLVARAESLDASLGGVPAVDERKALGETLKTLLGEVNRCLSTIDGATASLLEEPPLACCAIAGVKLGGVSTDWISAGRERFELLRLILAARPSASSRPEPGSLDGSEPIWIGFEDDNGGVVRVVMLSGTVRDGQVTRNKLRLQAISINTEAGVGPYLPIDYAVVRLEDGANGRPVYQASFSINLSALPRSRTAD